MYLTELWASCRRRWRILLVLLAISASLCWVVAGKVPPTYEANATLVLVPPRNVENPEANRYLDLGSLTDSVDVLARSMGSAETVDLLEAKAPGAHYEVMADETTSAPILLVTSSGGDTKSAQSMLAAVLKQVKVHLERLQESIEIRTPFRITLMQLSKDPEPKANQSDRLRVLGAVAVGLLLASALLVAALDGLLRRRDSEAQASESRPQRAGQLRPERVGVAPSGKVERMRAPPRGSKPHGPPPLRNTSPSSGGEGAADVAVLGRPGSSR